MNKTAQNSKWELMLYFLVATLATAAISFAGWFYLYASLSENGFLLGFLGILVLIGLSVGYYAAQRFQRQLDTLHLGMIQMAKGNLSGRIEFSCKNSFADLYEDFNEMAFSVEQRIKKLQQLGEEKVLEGDGGEEAAVLEERKRLARDLHDTVSQQLFAIHMAASSLPKVTEMDMAHAGKVMEQLIDMSHHAQKQLRGLISQLRPLELEGKSLEEALGAWFPDYCRQNGLQGSLDMQLYSDISEAKEHQLFLIIQEGMSNVVKHARAKLVNLSLHDIGHQYSLVISDDGGGFDVSSVKPGSYGLSTMKERAQKLGGGMELLSRPGSGTTMKIHIPKF